MSEALALPQPSPVPAPPLTAVTPAERRSFSERVNPIVVKELRRGLRTRVFTVSLVLLLATCVCIALFAWANQLGRASNGVVLHEGGIYDTDGRDLFLLVYGVMAFVNFFVVPFSAFRAIASERDERHWALLALTPLTPAKILFGRILAGAAQGVLFGSVAAPFLLFSYLLQGVDLHSVAFVGLASFAWQLVLLAICVAAAALFERGIFKGAMQFAILAVLGGATLAAIAATNELLRNPGDFFHDRAAPWVAAGFAWVVISYVAVLFGEAVGRLTPPSGNPALWSRLALIVQGLVSLAIGAVARWKTGENFFFVLVTVLGLAHASAMGLYLGTDSDGAARILRNRTGRALTWMVLPGALRGYRLHLLGCVLVPLVGLTLVKWDDYQTTKFLMIPALLPAHAVLFAAVPILLARTAFERLLPTQAAIRSFCLGAVAVALVVPPVLAEAVGRARDLQGLHPVSLLLCVDSHSCRRDLPEYAFLLWPLALAAAALCHLKLASAERESHG